MGTNFYLIKHIDDDDPEYHVGKRSAAGMYCWNCGRTLCKGGKSRIHCDDEWYDKCPKCGQKPMKEDMSESSAGRELGFNRGKSKKKKGVRSCSSFTWAMNIYRVTQTCWPRKKVIEDEYGRKYTRKQFNDILKECPVQFYDSIGEHFS